VGVAAAPWAGAELELEVDVRLDEAADEDDGDELLVDGVADAESLVAEDDRAAEEVCAVEVAGADVVGVDGVVGVVPDDDELSVSSPRVVFPDEEEFVTSADTGFCPISSIPVTIAIATAKTETA
jgi:hypothetical protein